MRRSFGTTISDLRRSEKVRPSDLKSSEPRFEFNITRNTITMRRITIYIRRIEVTVSRITI